MASSIHKKSQLTSLTSGGRLVGIVRSQTQAMEFSFFYAFACCHQYNFVTAGMFGRHNQF
jgi:hypothetical protein